MKHCIQCISPVSTSARLCTACGLFLRHYDRKRVDHEVRTFQKGAIEDGATLLEFSGGRHSCITLSLLRQSLNLNVIAVTLNNGFMPDAVIAQAKRISNNLGTRHLVVFDPFDVDSILEPEGGIAMEKCCNICNQKISSAVLGIARLLGIRWVANGENKYRSLLPRVTSLGTIASDNGKHYVNTINLPFALSVNRNAGDQILKKIGWKETKVSGLSSNCLVPWLSRESRTPCSSRNALCELVAAEVRTGYLTRDEGFAMIRGVSAATTSQLSQKLRSIKSRLKGCAAPIVVYDSGGHIQHKH